MHFFTKYRAFQLLGWGLFALLNIYIAAITQEISTPIIAMNILLAGLGFLCTHFYRHIILVQAWKKLTTEKLLLRIISMSLLLTVVFNMAYFIVLKLFQALLWLPASYTISMGTFISVLVLMLCWNAFYFTWNYVEHNRSLLIDRLRLESQMKDLEIKTIKANLQPHFIFNSLNSIRALIDENPALAREAITKISRILRQSISQQEATDTLENELHLVEDYLDLEKIRFEERLHFTKEIQQETLTFQIPTMMLQTIVENAIKHGISKIEQGGEIKLKTQLRQHSLFIEIKNTGTLQAETNYETGLGFGLSSTKQRLFLLYKDDASFDITEKNQEVIVSINIKNPSRL